MMAAGLCMVRRHALMTMTLCCARDAIVYDIVQHGSSTATYQHGAARVQMRTHQYAFQCDSVARLTMSCHSMTLSILASAVPL